MCIRDRGGVARFRDPRVDLACGQVAALAGLRALRHLDLDLLRADKVTTRHAEAAARDLLDGRAAVMVCSRGGEAVVALAALAAVRLAVEVVHRKRQRLVRLLRDLSLIHIFAFAVGYSNTSYFHRRFRKIYGMSPRDCRLHAREDPHK